MPHPVERRSHRRPTVRRAQHEAKVRRLEQLELRQADRPEQVDIGGPT